MINFIGYFSISIGCVNVMCGNVVIGACCIFNGVMMLTLD